MSIFKSRSERKEIAKSIARAVRVRFSASYDFGESYAIKEMRISKSVIYQSAYMVGEADIVRAARYAAYRIAGIDFEAEDDGFRMREFEVIG